MQRRFWHDSLVILCLAVAIAQAAGASAQEIQPSELAFWGVSTAALVAAWHLDDQLRRDDPAHRSRRTDRLARTGYTLGGSRTLVPAMWSAMAMSHVTGWPADLDRVANVVVGTAMAGLVTEAIKSSVGRGRPRDVHDPRQFQPFTRDNAWMAFPSGHATAGFGLATALAYEFDLGGWEAIGYGMAGMIAWSRVYHDAHWVSDTIAGAIVGIAVARVTVSWLHGRQDDGSPVAAASASPGIPIVLLHIPLP